MGGRGGGGAGSRAEPRARGACGKRVGGKMRADFPTRVPLSRRCRTRKRRVDNSPSNNYFTSRGRGAIVAARALRAAAESGATEVVARAFRLHPPLRDAVARLRDACARARPAARIHNRTFYNRSEPVFWAFHHSYLYDIKITFPNSTKKGQGICRISRVARNKSAGIRLQCFPVLRLYDGRILVDF